MNAKETFLKKLADQVKIYEEAIEFNKKLPESFFEGLQNDFHPGLETEKAISNINGIGLYKAEDNKYDYGKNKRTVTEILKNNNRVMMKGDIIDEYERITGENDAAKTVTNSLAALSTEKVVKGYKPEGYKIRGYYWGLLAWFENDELISEHKPTRNNLIKHL